MLAPHTSPLFVSAWRLLPAGVALIAWAAATGRRQPSGGMAWLAIALFGLVDGTCFQVDVPTGSRSRTVYDTLTLRGSDTWSACCRSRRDWRMEQNFSS